MTDREVFARVRYWLKHPLLIELGISHWRIDVETAEEPSGRQNAKAAITTSGYYDTATIQFAADYVDEASEIDLDRTIMHELIHIVWRDLGDASRSLGMHVSNDRADAYEDRLDHETEGVVDRIARTIVTLEHATHAEYGTLG